MPPSKTDETQPMRKKSGARNYFHTKVQKYKDGVLSVGREFSETCEQIDCKSYLRKTCTVDNARDKLPISRWLPNYRFHHFLGDLIAGITVGLTVIPQSLAYAKIAELPPQYGLYSAFMGNFANVLLGTSRDVAHGPTAVMALLTAEFGHSDIEGDARPAVLLTFVCGAIQIAMGILCIGFVVDFISHPVINSFTTASAITIACSQLKKWLGIRNVPRGFIPQLTSIASKLGETNVYDFLLGALCMVLLYLMQKMRETKFVKSGSDSRCLKALKYIIWLSSIARNAIVVLVATAAASVLYNYDLQPFSLTGNITGGFPSFELPEFSWTHGNETYSFADNIKHFGVGAVVVPVVGVIEVIAVGKAFGRKNNYNIEANQELLAIGTGNLLGSFVSAFPVTAGFSRSAVNSQSGVKTPAGGIFTGALVLLALGFLTPLFFYVPDAALAALIIMAVLDLIDFSMLPQMWRLSKRDILPWMTVFIISLLLGFEYGIILGVVVSLMLLLHPWSKPKLKMEEDPYSAKLLTDDIALFRLGHGLLFPGIDHLEDKILEAGFKGDSVMSVIVNFQHVSVIDISAIQGIQQIHLIFTKKKKVPTATLR